MTDPLDLALHSYRFWRDIGADVLIIALLVEFLIEAYWPEHPERRHLRLSRTQAMTFAAFVVFAGVGIERIWGTLADDKSDEIRNNLAGRVAHLKEIGPRDLSPDVQAKLVATWRKYAGQTITIEGHDDPDSGPLAYRFLELLRQAGVKVVQGTLPPNEWYSGVYIISGDPQDAEMLDTFSCSLMHVGIFSGSEPLWWFAGFCKGNPTFCKRRIVVGSKPPFFTSDQIRKLPCLKVAAGPGVPQ
jgi:hypothetical protein